MIFTKLTFLAVFSLLYILAITYIYFSKARLNNSENRIYKIMIIVNIIGIILHLLCDMVSFYYYVVPNYISMTIYRLYLIYFVIFINLLFLYLLMIISIKRKEDKKVSNIILILMFVECVITTVLPLNLYKNDVSNIYYTYGSAVDFIYIISAIIMFLIILLVFIKRKKIHKKKLIPIYVFILLGFFSILIQNNYPEIVIITEVETVICCLMYFTIENPDLKLINELNIAKEQAEKANNAKTEFLSNVSHEIRTPLNAIVGFSQTLMERELPSEARDEIKDILQASDNLLEIVNGILDISKIEANKVEIIEKEYESRQIFDELVSLTKARIGDKSLTFEVHIDELMPKFLYGDSTRLKQIVLNLLTNAVKYTKEGKICMMVSSVVKGDICRLIIAVEDTGIGIKPEKIDKLFTKFERLDVEKDITIEGTGLGLAITKKLVDLMHGQIVVSSTYGEGSKFTVAIDQKVATGENIKVKEPLKVQDFNNMKVLVVDDNKVNLKVANRMLAAFNVLVDEADSGEACLEKVKTNDYDLILLDIMMPHMSGVETLNHLKEMKVTSKVVALTADAISGMREKYLSDGFDGYLAKPIQKEELQNVLSKMYKEE